MIIMRNTAIIAQLGSGDWSVTLEKNGLGTVPVTDEWEWPAGIPSALDRTHVVDDNN